METVSNNQNTIIVGRSGAGKHLFATQRIVDNLVAGRAVVVLDCCRSYQPLAKALGGTVVQDTVEEFGTMPLTVIDLDGLVDPVRFGQLTLPDLTANSFVLVDDTVNVARKVSDLWPTLDGAIARGVGVCVVVQTLEDVASEDRPQGLIILTEWQPNQLCRHQDGGIYRYLFTSKHTSDLSELVQYEHVWPFEPGAKWSRPVGEWDCRFTPITVADLAEAQKTDPTQAQAAIAQAKAARRAAAK